MPGGLNLPWLRSGEGIIVSWGSSLGCASDGWPNDYGHLAAGPNCTVRTFFWMCHRDVMGRLAELFIDQGAPECLGSDNGSEFKAQTIRDWLKALGVRTLYIEPGSPWVDWYVESFNSELRDELLNREVFETLGEV